MPNFHIHVEYLGHIIYPSELGVHKAKDVETISKIPQSRNVHWLWIFLGLCNYYWRLVKRFNNIGKPLTQLTRINHEYIWIETQERAFQ